MRIVSGIQPTGTMHLGNYLGAVQNWVRLQTEAECVFFIANLHAMTMPFHPMTLRNNVFDTMAMLMACGVRPDLATIFPQHKVTAHTELAWYLTCVARMGWMERMVQFKAKAEDQETVGVGLFSYPILQAADILLYDATHVPVGDDQDQHIQLARDIVKKANHDFKADLFVMPKALMPDTCARVMSLFDPTKKMSKSGLKAHRIDMTDSDDIIAKKMKRATADSITALPSEEAGLVDRPAVGNLVSILAAVTNSSVDRALAELNGCGNGGLKSRLADALVEMIGPIRMRYEQFREDETTLLCDLLNGAVKANNLADRKMERVREVMLKSGYLYF